MDTEIQPEDLAYLMRWFGLKIMLLDLQQNQPSDFPHGHVMCSTWIPSLVENIAKFPNTGSFIYAIITDPIFTSHLKHLAPSLIVLYDRDGSETGVARRWAEMMPKIRQTSGYDMWSGCEAVLSLAGGFEAFARKFPFATSHSNSRRSAVELTPLVVPESPSVLHLRQVAGVDDPPSMITPHIYLSGLVGTSMRHVMDLQVDHVVSVGEMPLVIRDISPATQFTPLITPSSPVSSSTGRRNVFELALQMASHPHHSRSSHPEIQMHQVAEDSRRPLTHYMFTIEDVSHAPLDRVFTPISSILARAMADDERVLVHCHAGVSRSSSVIIAHLIISGMSLAEAFARVYTARPCIRPNEGFWGRLQMLEREIRKDREHVLADHTLPSRIPRLLASTSLSYAQFRQARVDRVSEWLELCRRLDTADMGVSVDTQLFGYLSE